MNKDLVYIRPSFLDIFEVKNVIVFNNLKFLIWFKSKLLGFKVINDCSGNMVLKSNLNVRANKNWLLGTAELQMLSWASRAFNSE